MRGPSFAFIALANSLPMLKNARSLQVHLLWLGIG